MRDAAHDSDIEVKLTCYALIVFALILLALLSFLLAPQGSGVSSCTRLVFQSSKFTCITSVALSQKNVSLCAYEQGVYRDSCYAQLAQALGRPRICNNINDSFSRSACATSMAMASGNYTACKLAAEPLASGCEERVALQANNQSECAGIANASDALVCSSSVSIRYAIRTGNASYCRQVSYTANKNLTAQIVGFTIRNSSAPGAPYSQNSFLQGSLFLLPNVTFTPRDYCYSTLATMLGNAGLCANVSAGQASGLCTLQVGSAARKNTTANYTSMLAACAKLGTYAQQCSQSVLLSQAVSTRNATLCGKLQPLLSSGCYTALAQAYMNATYCNYISDPAQKSACVSGA